jgi:AcrR family transcriptional regulator
MSKGGTLRDRTTAAIIDSAAAIMAEQGNGASLESIATAAGISRATLYRYFPNREALLHAMAMASIEELAVRVADADLRGIPVEQAIARLVRGFVAIGSKYVAVSSSGRTSHHPNVDTVMIAPVVELFKRGIAEGSLRPDIDPELLVDLFSGLIKAALDMTSQERAGVEEASAAVTDLFLGGIRAKPLSSRA